MSRLPNSAPSSRALRPTPDQARPKTESGDRNPARRTRRASNLVQGVTYPGLRVVPDSIPVRTATGSRDAVRFLAMRSRSARLSVYCRTIARSSEAHAHRVLSNTPFAAVYVTQLENLAQQLIRRPSTGEAAIINNSVRANRFDHDQTIDPHQSCQYCCRVSGSRASVPSRESSTCHLSTSCISRKRKALGPTAWWRRNT
jgi:hypothetical protein